MKWIDTFRAAVCFGSLAGCGQLLGADSLTVRDAGPPAQDASSPEDAGPSRAADAGPEAGDSGPADAGQAPPECRFDQPSTPLGQCEFTP
jgi:hypothetical protein